MTSIHASEPARLAPRLFAVAATLFATPALADYVIAPTGGDISGARLSAQLAAGDVSLAAASGNLVVDDAVNWSAHTLTLSAPSGSVNVNAVMAASGSASLSLETDASAADGGVAMALTAGGFTGRVDFTGTGQSYKVNGTAYTLIHTLAELEAIRPPANGIITGAYALAADVDWSGAASQTPLGFLGGSGRFDGLGHRLLDLVIAGSADDTGLFSYNSGGVIRNLGVRGGSVSGGGWVGALVGDNFGVLAHVYSTADVSGILFVGGLVGLHNGSGSLITHAWADGNVSGTGAVGGLVGTTQSGGAVNNVWASGNVTGQDSIGGLVGVTQTNASVSETLRNAYATGNVTGSIQVGGLVGHNMSPVEHVFATGGVSASSNSYVGGLVGLSDGGGSVSDGWFASDTAGAHPANGFGTAIPLANLVSALPGSFDAAVWADQNGRTTPYLQSVPGAVYVKAESASAASARVYMPVTTLDQLQAINNNLAGAFALFNDLDASATANWNGGAGFVPIGNCAGGFNGRFDGLGHVVLDPTINSGSSSLCVGLFGGLGVGAVLRNVGVDGGSVTGGNAVGGLVGYNDAGAISNAFATARVSATSSGGGLVGFTTGDVSDAYATGSVIVSGTDAGGLTGGSRGAIRRTWASGKVTGSGSNVGGLVGLAMSGSVADSYWDRFSTGQGVAVGVVTSATATNLNAVSSDPAQAAATHYAFKQGAYASLDFGSSWTAFDGTRPFLRSEWQTTLTNAHQLQLMSLKLDANYMLGRNIDAGETGRNDGMAANSNGMWAQTGFMRVGTDGPRFVGSLDGQYHVIGGFAINRPTIDSWVGLFGKTGGAVVKNLGMANVSIVGSSAVGGLIGLSQGGSVSRVYVTGSVSGAGSVGGIVGGMQGGSLDNAYANASVSSAGNYVGGVTGGNQAGSIGDVYASGNVSGPNAAGLVGYNADATGAVIDDGFWNTDVAAQGIGTADTAGGLSHGVTGLSTLHWLSQGPVATGLWSTTNGWVAGYPYPVLKGFPYVLVVAQGAHVTQGVAAVTVDSYSVVDQDGNDASALVTGTPTWFADPGLAAGATAHVGGTGVVVLNPFYQLAYIGAGTVMPPQAPNLALALTQAGPDYVTYGQIVDYVVTLSNSGNAVATNVAVHAAFGGGADVAAATWQCIAGSTAANCTIAGGGPITDHVTIPPGVSMTWLIHVPVAASTPAGTLEFDFGADGLDPLQNSAIIVLFRDGFD